MDPYSDLVPRFDVRPSDTAVPCSSFGGIRTANAHGPMRTKKPVRNNYVLVVFDSCRYDSLQRARPKNIKRLGSVEKRWSYASWTSPSHYNLLIGLMPHSS